ncbi:MAG: hypothetical protein KKF89_00295 [Nanoarchaeota archaeon]|nr:hypothetical protein [Nanoarchaeota archaeon]MBU1854135.1 hypothetical protein [Nanoarchaeota archaeon]
MKRTCLLLLLLLIPFASALEITELEFLEFQSHGRPLTTVSMGRIPNIDLKMVISGDDFQWLEADISGLNRDYTIVQQLNYESSSLLASDCERLNDTFVCYIRKIILLLPSDTVLIPITLHNETTSVVVEEAYTFDIDNTAPNVTFMGTENCLNQTCFIASDISTKILISFADEKATFDKKIISYSLNDKKRFAYVCEGLNCYGYGKVSCQSGQMIPLEIRPLETMDDAYNLVSNNFRNDLLCDSDAPVVESVLIGGESEGKSKEYIKLGDTVVITMNVSENLGEVSVEGNFSGFGGGIEQGTCSKKGNLWLCEIRSTVSGDGPFMGKADLSVRDTAGNIHRFNVEKEVWGLDEEMEIDEWTVGNVRGMPNLLNVDVVRHTTSDVNIYYSIPLIPKFQDLEILEFVPEKCVKKQNVSLFNEADFKLFNAFRGTKNPFIVGTIAARTYEPGIFNYECVLKIRSRKGQYYHTNYEVENITLTIELEEAGNAKDMIEAELEDLLGHWTLSEGWETFSGLVKYYESACGTVTRSMQMTLGFNKIYQSMSSYFEVDRTKGEAAKQSSQASSEASESFLKTFGTVSCSLATCDGSLTEKVFGGLVELGDSMCELKVVSDVIEFSGGGKGYNKDGTLKCGPDPYDSIVWAVAMGCLPAVNQHLVKLRNIELSYAECLMDGYTSYIPASTCQETQAISTCTFWAGQIFNIFPAYTAVKRGLSKIKNVLKNPYSLIGLAPVVACRFIPSITSHSFCVVTVSSAELISIVAKDLPYVINNVKQVIGPISKSSDTIKQKFESMKNG